MHMMTASDPALVLYEQQDHVALITLNRPEVRNAQNAALLYALDTEFQKAALDDSVSVVVLRGNGKAFSAGHDIGPTRDADVSYPRRTMWSDHVGKPTVESRLHWESEIYMEFSWKWRDLPKPTIAMVHGACIGGGLMLAWVCDLIVASEDAYFSDPVVLAGSPGVEFFCHPWQMGVRQAKEFLFLGERMSAQRAYEVGMVNRVIANDQLESETMEIARRIAAKPRFALTLTKKVVNASEEAMGVRFGVNHAFGYHLLSHAAFTEPTTVEMLRAEPRE
jgi:enoyl-CoA hydratase